MRTVGQRMIAELPAAVPVPGALARAAAHLATVLALESRVMIRRGVYRLSHAEANRQMDAATIELMAAIVRERSRA